MIEMVFAVLVAAILTSVAVSNASEYLARRGTQNARDAFVFLSYRARASAVERGVPLRLEIDAVRDHAWIVTRCSGSVGVDTLVNHYFGNDHVNVLTPSDARVTICYSPRGFATDRNPNPSGELMVRFGRGGDTASAAIGVLGQVQGR